MIVQRVARTYVRCERRCAKYYKAILEEDRTAGWVRVSRREFKRASDAESYRLAVLTRLARMRG